MSGAHPSAMLGEHKVTSHARQPINSNAVKGHKDCENTLVKGEPPLDEDIPSAEVFPTKKQFKVQEFFSADGKEEDLVKVWKKGNIHGSVKEQVHYSTETEPTSEKRSSGYCTFSRAQR